MLGGVPPARKGTTGIQNSAPRGKSRPGGITPTISTVFPSRIIVVPTTLGSDPNRRTQAPWFSTATAGALGTSSSARNVRPSSGLTPSVSKKPADTPLNQMRDGSPRPWRTALQLCDPITAARVKVFPAAVHSRRCR